MKTLSRTCSLLVLLAATAATAEPVDETRAMNANGRVSVEMVNGRVNIRTWDRDEFHIEGELSEAATGFVLEDRGGDIEFREEYPQRGNGCRFGNNCGNGGSFDSEYEILIPESASLDFSAVNVNVDVAGLGADANISLVNGNIEAADITGDVEFSTVNGRIQTRGLQGRSELSTVNGTIEDSGSSGPRATMSTVNGTISSDSSSPRISLSTVNGRINANSRSVRELEASTVGGTLDLAVSLDGAAELEATSLGGNITVTLPASTSARFDINSNFGNIRNGLSNAEPRRQSPNGQGEELEFTLGDGSARVELSSFTGNIRLDRE